MLDVGCGVGAFGAACKDRLGCEARGIEFVPEIGALAQERLDKVFIGDAMEILPTLPPSSFDLVSFTDVLEHLVEPAEALRRTLPLLTPGGRILASIPNIRHWDALLNIVRDKDFPYQDFGIFDRTHLRFFTKKSLPRLFEDAGCEIERLEGINPTPSRKLRMLNLLTFNRWEDCKYLQFVIVAKAAGS